MPLVTRQANQGLLFKQDLEPGTSLDGDLWSDTTANILKLNVSGTFEDVGKTSFSDSATVSFSVTIGDYVQPDSATATSGGTADVYDFLLESVTSIKVSSDEPSRLGIKIDAGSSAIGKSVKKVKVRGFIFTGTTGNAFVKIRNSSDTEIAGAPAFDVTNWNDATDTTTEFTLDNEIILASGDRITFEFSADGGAQGVGLRRGSTTSPSGFTTQSFNGSVWANNGTDVISFNFDSSPVSTAGNAVDDNTGTVWQSDQQVNPAIFVDEGENNNFVGVVLFWNANTTETSFTIRVSTDNTFSAAEDVRTILTSAMTNGAFNFIRFNVKVGRFLQIRGASGSSLVLAINEIKDLLKTDSEILADLGILEISPTDTSLALDGT